MSDVVVRGEVPPAIRQNMELWIGCVAGALTDTDYLAKLAAAGFENAAIEVTRIYTVDDAKEFLAGQGEDLARLAQEVDGKFVSGFVRATKPQGTPATRSVADAQTSTAASSCCASTCCGG